MRLAQLILLAMASTPLSISAPIPANRAGSGTASDILGAVSQGLGGGLTTGGLVTGIVGSGLGAGGI
ncbi:hypothetical protein GQ602_003472 [Ophiocordyceps camponoti-floridani]|uniref:Uncharacterized protein n=1 Tax=Ophiocordyceps camponoti-floridani TaxID=2030778 RepID=A0A8H4Q899_9HYPO|nr:hypothetical protein GQ602_003472 [Ophiocordyceps camponoti-floridani]